MQITALSSLLLLAVGAASAAEETSYDAKAAKATEATEASHSVKAKSSKMFKSESKSAKSAKAYSKATSGGATTHASAASHSTDSHASAGSHASADGCPADFLDSKATSSYLDDAHNKCAGAKLALANKLCVDLGVQPQAGANVTKGYVGAMDMGAIVPTTGPYWANKMCPVNVHWHLGTEHYSVGEYDEGGDGPHGGPDDWEARRLSADGEVRDGFRCRHYDAADEKFTTAYKWEHCVDMEVGETYEVHWPHSAAGACGTVNQYQTPFYDGVFCNLPSEAFATLGAEDIAGAVGVHGQVFTIVNDEAYFYPDMIRGMVVDEDHGMGTDVTKYTGSTTGTSRDNEMCSQYAPITWQVDRKCHLISASSFDKLCYDMKMQRDDMSGDLYPHGSRILVADAYVGNNHVNRKNLRA